jgi:hypothetical protein
MSGPRPRLRLALIALSLGAGLVATPQPARAYFGTSFTASPGGAFDAAPAHFGPQRFDLVAQIVPTADAVGIASDGCTAPINTVAGKVIIVDRGACPFEQKAGVAQAAGAIGLVIANNVAGPPPQMIDEPTLTATITIPLVGIAGADGAATRSAIAAGSVSGRLVRTPIPRRLTLSYTKSTSTFAGVATSTGGCISMRTVSIHKKPEGRRARVVGQTVTDATGAYSLVLRAKRARYHATVSPEMDGPFECAAARSNKVRRR